MKKFKKFQHEKEFDTKTLFSQTEGVVKQQADPEEKTRVYEPRPLTPDDDIYEDILEQFASAPTKPKYWFEEFGDYWSCSCGHINKGAHCKNCGLERELLRSLFILHKPADAPGKLNKKLKKAKDRVDKEEIFHAERERQKQQAGGDIENIRPIAPVLGTNLPEEEAAEEAGPQNGTAEAVSAEAKGPEAPKNAEGAATGPANPNPANSKPVNPQSANPQHAEPESAAPAAKNHKTANSAITNSADKKPAAAVSLQRSKTSDAEAPTTDGKSLILTVEPVAQNNPKKLTRKRIIIIAVIAALLLLLAAGGTAAYIYLAAPAMQYEDALQLKADGKYEKAIKKFEALGDYKDSPEQIWECYIAIGDRQYESGEYQAAIETYNIAMELKESDKIQDRIRKCHIAMGDQYYAGGDFENALGAYAAAMEIKDSDSLREKINKVKFSYVEANLSKRGQQVETYMAELMALNYPGIRALYDAYYEWHVKIVANTSADDYSNDLETASRNDTVYFHVTLSGGEPGEEIELYYQITWPNGTSQVSSLESKWKSGSQITARFQYPIPLFGKEGKMTFQLFDKATNRSMGSDSITLEK